MEADKQGCSSLGELIAAIEGAVEQAGRRVQAQQLENLQAYFTQDNEPVVIPLRLPSYGPDGTLEYTTVQVPRLCLTPIHHLRMSEAVFDFQVRLGKMGEENGVSASHPSVLVELPDSLQKNVAYAQIHLKFEAADTPEGAMRLNDHLVKLL